MADTKTIVANKPGWADLSSADAAASRDFYTRLFGWQADVSPDPEAGGYGMFKRDGKEVAGVVPRQSDQQPTAWTIYILVDDADATAQRATAAGGTVIVPPFDVMEAGRMAVIADPSGAVFGIWQAGTHAGWEVEGVAGAVCWVELTSHNFDAAQKFYTDVFGWVARRSEMSTPEMVYTTFSFNPDDNGFAGGMQAPESMPDGAPSYWQPYIATTDVDDAAGKAKELGATAIVEPADIPMVGRFAIIKDPQGAIFGLLQPLPPVG